MSLQQSSAVLNYPSQSQGAEELFSNEGIYRTLPVTRESLGSSTAPLSSVGSRSVSRAPSYASSIPVSRSSTLSSVPSPTRSTASSIPVSRSSTLSSVPSPTRSVASSTRVLSPTRTSSAASYVSPIPVASSRTPVASPSRSVLVAEDIPSAAYSESGLAPSLSPVSSPTRFSSAASPSRSTFTSSRLLPSRENSTRLREDSHLVGEGSVIYPSRRSRSMSSSARIPPLRTISLDSLDRTRSASVSVPQVALLKDAIEKKFYTVRKFMVVSDGKSKRYSYIKATNPFGEKVYIYNDLFDINLADGEKVEDRDYFEESKGITATSVSAKFGNYECVKNRTCGVAIECDHGVCILKVGDEEHPLKEENLLVTRRYRNPEVFVRDSSNHAYPLVKLSEIMNDPKSSLEQQHQAYVTLRNQEQDNIGDDLAQIYRDLESMLSALVDIKDLGRNIAFDLQAQTASLASASHHLLDSNASAEEYSSVRDGFKATAKDRMRMIAILGRLSKLKQPINELARQIFDIAEELHQ